MPSVSFLSPDEIKIFLLFREILLSFWHYSQSEKESNFQGGGDIAGGKVTFFFSR
ncbi:hypothetical protein LTSEADE_3551 [Salmonella enterica subsp. enterica serovar Adelaide str. A4-669]|uniref:Uncharacterized protein n=1 Tax=Salmonella enterica subsp. enterica serovar Adelaide str. A4-669 TaxID=913063 RepID=A0A6C8GKL5_SALET|nr:hypothetical protein LTSEADE_3551 [Salmonella enterica subsp. enterica serovar Adelaide str. A4-669]